MPDRCPICQSGPNPLFSTRRWAFPFGGKMFSVHACGKCRGYYTWPRPTAEELGRIYVEFYNYEWFARRSLLKKIQAWHRWRRLRGTLRGIGDGVVPRFLDVGCGHGHFLVHAKHAGWEAVGADFPSAATEHARKVYGLNVVEGDFLSMAGGERLAVNSFDVVTMWHCLEHTVDPLQFMETAGRLVREGGLLIVAVPNSGCHAFGRLREKWTWYQEPFVHTVHLNEPSMRVLAARAGMEVISITSRDTWDANWLCDDFLFEEFQILIRALRAAGPTLSLTGEQAPRLLLYGASAVKYWAAGVESTGRSGMELLATLQPRRR